MSELLNYKDQDLKRENLSQPERAEYRHEEQKSSERLKENESHDLESIRSSIEQNALSSKEVPFENNSESSAAQPTFVNRELKDMALGRLLQRTRRQLNPADRALSKVVHQPVIEKINDVAGSTVARPAGLLGGGLFSLLGGGILLILVKHYGYEYNFFAFIALFLAGFIVFNLADMLLSLVKRSHQS